MSDPLRWRQMPGALSGCGTEKRMALHASGAIA
jgi:hypothetical protein